MDFACEIFASVSDFNCDCGELEDEDKLALLEDASDLLAYLSGGKVVGRCSGTLRPCRTGWPCFRLGRCCCDVDGIELRTPIVSVDLVTIDGMAVPSGEYAVVDNHKLVRKTGFWPGCQDIRKSADEEGTFAVTYTFGRRPPMIARLATAELACAFNQEMTAADRQKLPLNTTSVSHQGIQIGLRTRAQTIKSLDIDINLPYVQQFVSIYGLGKPGGTLVYSPEMYDGWTYHTQG